MLHKDLTGDDLHVNKLHSATHEPGGTDPIGAPSVVNVKMFGAVGNGVTDDTVAIQAAIDATKIAKGTVYFPPGEYVCSTSLDITNTFGVCLLGAGCKASKIIGRAAIGNYPIMDFTMSNSCGIEKIGIQVYTGETCFVGVLLSRAASESSGSHVLRDVLIVGKFSKALLYMVSSEGNQFYSFVAANTLENSDVLVIRDVKEAGVDSLYQPIGTVTGGNTYNSFINCAFYHDPGVAHANNTAIRITKAERLLFVGCYIKEKDAISGIVIDSVDTLAFYALTAEGPMTNTIYFTGINGYWDIRTSHFQSSLVALYGADNSILHHSSIEANAMPATALDVYTLNNCVIDGGDRIVSVRGANIDNIFRNCSGQDSIVPTINVYGLFLAALARHGALTNLIVNGDFETNTTGWAGGDATLSRETGSPLVGTGSLKVLLTADGGFTYQGVTCVAGNTYYMTALVKTTAAAGRFIRLSVSTGGIATGVAVDASAGTTLVSLVFVANATTAIPYAQLVNGITGESFLLDSVVYYDLSA